MSEVEDYGCSESEMSWEAESDDEADFIHDSPPDPHTPAHVASFTIIDRHQLGRIQARTWSPLSRGSTGFEL